MYTLEIEWSSAEKQQAKTALDKAYDREISALISETRRQSTTVETVEALWQLHDFLSARRFEIDGKYDDHEAGLLFVLATLVKEGWLQVDELSGLNASKVTKIAALAQMS